MAQTHRSRLLEALTSIAEDPKATHEQKLAAAMQAIEIQQHRKKRLTKKSSLLGE